MLLVMLSVTNTKGNLSRLTQAVINTILLPFCILNVVAGVFSSNLFIYFQMWRPHKMSVSARVTVLFQFGLILWRDSSWHSKEKEALKGFSKKAKHPQE